MKLCDRCGARHVNNKDIPPLVEVFGANVRIPWAHVACSECGSVENCSEYPDYLLVNVIKKEK